MSTVYGPTPDEAVFACHVAIAAEDFLDAWIEHKIEARHIKELASALDNFHHMFHSFRNRAEQLDAVEDATSTGMDGNNNRLAFEVPD